MLKPKHLSPGDRVAVVSLSSGILGEAQFIHKYHIAKERLERDCGLRVVTDEDGALLRTEAVEAPGTSL